MYTTDQINNIMESSGMPGNYIGGNYQSMMDPTTGLSPNVKMGMNPIEMEYQNVMGNDLFSGMVGNHMGDMANMMGMPNMANFETMS